MNPTRLVRLLLFQLCLAPSVQADPDDAHRLSPDGRFSFVGFSTEDYDAGKKPAFGIIEVATGKLVSNPDEDLGDPYRPEESILWAPDSLSYALTTRVGTRHLDTFLYRWDGTSFVRAQWEGDGTIESWADETVAAALPGLGFSDAARRGETVAGDGLGERWLDPHRIILTDVQECLISEGDREEVVTGSARAIVRWDEASQSFQIERRLDIAPPRVPGVDEETLFDVTQSDLPGDDPTAKRLVVRHRETGESMAFEAENWMSAPTLKVEVNGWPQIELVSRGPSEFLWHRLYRFMDGAYRCYRIEEFTRQASQAPEGAPLIEVSPGHSLFLIRSRLFRDGDPETFESFQTESLSPDGAWKTVSTFTPQYLQRVEIVDAKGATEAVVIYDFDNGDGWVDAICETVWRPDSATFAFYLQEGPRVSSTLLYHRSDRVWSAAPMPEIDYGFLQPAIDNGATWGHQHERPLWWRNDRELMLELSGFFKGEDGIDYSAHSVLRWNEKGEPAGSESISLGRP